eukprot:CAMPEP_0171098024 /NCGR_PEP_ID=MMETSP0766_2-20121228/47888_1 /TAXON_ID=439317 /ORGANISM="Gambierdiscus australes, Strain CAWD 149" /LENGTH=102 /DNA_ID=CAMNT_0011557311 /DNA_START=250 /DNA_END=554 /DNA_ORIENTATION=-
MQTGQLVGRTSAAFQLPLKESALRLAALAAAVRVRVAGSMKAAPTDGAFAVVTALLALAAAPTSSAAFRAPSGGARTKGAWCLMRTCAPPLLIKQILKPDGL